MSPLTTAVRAGGQLPEEPVVEWLTRWDSPAHTESYLQDADEDIAEFGDGSVILCTDDYTIYDEIEEKEGVDGHLVVTHSNTYVIGDAHTNTCENRHSFLRQWLANFRGVSKHHLQRCLNFLEIKLNEPDSWFEKLLCYNVSG